MAKGEKTKQTIKDEALNLFSTLGYAGGSVRDIGKKVGVRESALYNYFPSKEAILLELITDAKTKSATIHLLSDKLLEYLSKPKLFIEQFTSTLLSFWNEDDQKKYLRLILIEQFRKSNSSSISVNILIDDTIKIWEMIFTQMLSHKVIKKESPKILANEFVYPLFMLRLQYLTNNNVNWETLNKDSQLHINYFWNSIKK